ncbi:DUF481 domain-containing protein [Sulfurimonas aquatica]|uniref:DUF481 domain-containing protein n=1 Tax=Sulfurimonas aquatica TaxID=2672570 RepID=A0A975GBY4_9BACT|nr:DUF481 domain-containing protein [Sulfurimonas aquatica]QSZ40718.1 DUF481 domain-containing protein [Sulfurimonas aquatica]
MKKILLSTILASSLVVVAQAATEETPLVTHTELGYIETSGNTQTQTFNLDANAKKSWGKHVGNAMLDGQYATNKNATSGDVERIKNKYVAELTYDYDFTKRFAFTYLAGYKADEFSSFGYQYYTGPGAKYKAIVAKSHNLTVEAGALYAADKFNDTLAITNKKEDTYAAYRLKALFDWKIVDNLKFNQEVSMRGSFEETKNYFIYSKSGFTSKFSDMFSAGLSYKVDYVATPAAGVQDTDTTLTLNLIVDY